MKTLIKLILAVGLVSATSAQQPSQPPKPGPEHQKLALVDGKTWLPSFTLTATKVKAPASQTASVEQELIAQQPLEPPSGMRAEPPRSSGVVTVRGTALPYLTEGSGIPCIVAGYSTLYPGAFSDELKKHIRFIFVDWKNSFLADDPFPLATNITIDTLVDDLDEVRRQLGHETPHSWLG